MNFPLFIAWRGFLALLIIVTSPIWFPFCMVAVVVLYPLIWAYESFHEWYRDQRHEWVDAQREASEK